LWSKTKCSFSAAAAAAQKVEVRNKLAVRCTLDVSKRETPSPLSQRCKGRAGLPETLKLPGLMDFGGKGKKIVDR
jgi:hypothetical protein